MIGVIDYGASNLQSVHHALTHLHVETRLVRAPGELDGLRALVLPGVGAFGAGMDQLRAAGFEEPIRRLAAEGVPLLGICLGMQFLFDASEEMGEHRGLGLLPGRVVRFAAGTLKIPHMGWNQLRRVRESPLLDGVPDGGYAYFVHSYYVQPQRPEDVLAETEYGLNFPAVVGRGNVFGVQFHPEKSQQVGLRLLQNFVERVQ